MRGQQEGLPGLPGPRHQVLPARLGATRRRLLWQGGRPCPRSPRALLLEGILLVVVLLLLLRECALAAACPRVLAAAAGTVAWLARRACCRSP